MSRLILVVVLVTACSSGPKKVAMPPPVDVPAVAAEPSACANLPAGHEVFATLGWGDALYDPDFGLGDKRDQPLTGFFPEIEAARGRVVAATPVEADGDATQPEMAAFYVPEGGSAQGDFAVDHQFVLALFRCGATGFERLGPDVEQMRGTHVLVHATQLITLPDGRPGSSIRVLHGFPAMEMVMYEHVLGGGAEIGTVSVGQQAIADGGGTWRWSAIGGSGWFPVGDGLRYVALVYGYDADQDGATGLSASVQAILGAGGLQAGDIETAGWALFGTGEVPAWCDAAPGRLRCARIDAGDVRMAAGAEGRFAYTWWTAGWETAEEAKAAIEAAGGQVIAGDWEYLGFVDEEAGEPWPAGPDGKPPAAKLEFTP